MIAGNYTINATINSTGGIVGGNSTDGTIVAISTVDDFMLMADKTYSGITFVQTDHIAIESDIGNICLINCTFDGLGYMLENEYDGSRSSESIGGLFEEVDNCTIKNLWLQVDNLETGMNPLCVGGLAARGINTTVSNCWIESWVYDKDPELIQGNYFGGVFGQMQGGNINNCAVYMYAELGRDRDQFAGYVGGMVGLLTSPATISDSFVHLDVATGTAGTNSNIDFIQGGGPPDANVTDVFMKQNSANVRPKKKSLS